MAKGKAGSESARTSQKAKRKWQKAKPGQRAQGQVKRQSANGKRQSRGSRSRPRGHAQTTLSFRSVSRRRGISPWSLFRDTPTQSEIPPLRSAQGRNDISWYPGARQPTGMTDFHENGSPPPKEEGVGVVAQRSTTPGPSLSKEGNHASIFMQGCEPKDHAIRARNDNRGHGMTGKGAERQWAVLPFAL
jgi:hypothetical protein